MDTNFSDYLQDPLNGSSTQNNLNKSFVSTYSNNSLTSINTASSSKAVLAALKALQDKIRRLETERSQALDEISALKLEMKNQEIEFENIKQKELLNHNKLIQESKLNYDHLVTEKMDLELKLNKLLERNQSISDFSNNLTMKLQLLEEEKQSLILKVKNLEYDNTQMDLQIKQSQFHEKEMAQSLAHESRRQNEEIQSLQSQIIHLQSNHQELLIEKDGLQHKLMELDLLIEQLLKLNESLITQLSGKPFKFTSKIPSKSKVLSSSSHAMGSQVPTIEMIASEASKLLLKSLEKKGSKTTPSMSISKSLENIEQMKLMHKIYSDIARKMTKLSSPSRGKSPKRTTSSSLKRSNSQFGEGFDTDNDEYNYDSSASNGKKTRMKIKKESSANNVSSYSVNTTGTSTPSSSKKKSTKSALKRSSSNYSNVTNLTGDFTLSDEPKPDQLNHSSGKYSTHHDVVLPRANVSFDRPISTISYIQPQPSQSPPNPNEKYEDLSNAYRRDVTTSNNNNSINNTSSASNSVKSSSIPIKQDINNMISQLEDEFSALNLQYRNLLSNVQANSTSLNVENITADNIQSQAEEIVNVIQKLHEKGEQIRTLRSPVKN